MDTLTIDLPTSGAHNFSREILHDIGGKASDGERNFSIVLLYIVFKITHGTQFIISHKNRLGSVEIQLGNHVFQAQPTDSHKFKLM